MSPSLIFLPPNSLLLAAKVTRPVPTDASASVISCALLSAEISGSKLSIAVIPCGIVLVGTMMTFLSFTIGIVCSAARMMFLLFGRTRTFLAGVAIIAS